MWLKNIYTALKLWQIIRRHFIQIFYELKKLLKNHWHQSIKKIQSTVQWMTFSFFAHPCSYTRYSRTDCSRANTSVLCVSNVGVNQLKKTVYTNLWIICTWLQILNLHGSLFEKWDSRICFVYWRHWLKLTVVKLLSANASTAKQNWILFIFLLDIF